MLYANHRVKQNHTFAWQPAQATKCQETRCLNISWHRQEKSLEIILTEVSIGGAEMTGKRIGYIRVSTVCQNTERQLHGLELDKVFEDKCSGRTTERPRLQECLAYLREGDVLYVHAIARRGRNLRVLFNMVI